MAETFWSLVGPTLQSLVVLSALAFPALAYLVHEQQSRRRLNPQPRAARDESQFTEGRSPQHVLKAEGASPDATDRENCANASPGGGPMGVGQAAAAAPAGVKTPDGEQHGD